MEKQKTIALNTFNDERCLMDELNSVRWDYNLSSQIPQVTIKVFREEISSKAPRTKYFTNKTKIFGIDDIWSLNVIDLGEYGPENIRGFIYL